MSLREKIKNLFKHFLDFSVISNFISMGLATLLSNLIGLITLGYSARILGPEKYGLAIFGSSVAAYASLALSPGLTKWGTRAIAQKNEETGEILIVINSVQLLLAFIAYVFLFFFGKGRFTDSELKIVLLSSVNIFITAFAIDWVYYGLELMRVTAWFGVLGSFLTTIALLGVIHKPDDVFLLPIITFTISLFIEICLYYFLINIAKRSIKFYFPPFKLFKKAIIDSIPLGLISILIVLHKNANNFFIKASLGVAFVGVFYAANRLIELSTTIVQMLNVVVFPRLSRKAFIDPLTARIESSLYIRFLITIGAGICAFAFAESANIINLIYGSKYSSFGAIGIFKILSLNIFLISASLGYSGSLLAFKKDIDSLKIVICMAIVSIGGGAIIVPRFGMTGAAWVIVCVELVGLIISIVMYKNALGRYGFETWGWPILGSILIILASFILSNVGVNFLIRIICEATIYLPFIFINIKPIFRRLMTSNSV